MMSKVISGKWNETSKVLPNDREKVLVDGDCGLHLCFFEEQGKRFWGTSFTVDWWMRIPRKPRKIQP
jgi:hypothetical protein